MADHFRLEFKENEKFEDFWRCVTLCNEVEVFNFDNKDLFSGTSSDEVAILEMAKESGVANLVFKRKEKFNIELQRGKEKI